MAKRAAIFIGMFVGIGILGLVVGLIAGLAGGFILRDELFGFGGLVGALAGIMIGYPIGVIIGVIIVNKAFHIAGSLWLGIAGSVVGGVIIIALNNMIALTPNQIFGSYFSVVALLATIGFHLKRKVKSERVEIKRPL